MTKLFEWLVILQFSATNLLKQGQWIHALCKLLELNKMLVNWIVYKIIIIRMILLQPNKMLTKVICMRDFCTSTCRKLQTFLTFSLELMLVTSFLLKYLKRVIQPESLSVWPAVSMKYSHNYLYFTLKIFLAHKYFPKLNYQLPKYTDMNNHKRSI